ncbi:hypothetical protein [Paenibacillus popilliae]|uniref:hypothetical protein n=1 Tax=Paenibacillus popilliae TaxID=78057 RepID=UPI0003139104|nr:hypothetical protein [Paenibacillus popilliae]
MLQQLKMYGHIAVRGRDIVYIIGFFILLAVLKASLLYYTKTTFSLSLGMWEFIFFSFGGLHCYDSYLLMIGWVLPFFPLVYVSYNLFSNHPVYEVYIYTRMNTRCSWWLGKTVAHICLSLGYSFILVMVHFIIGFLFFSFSTKIDLHALGYQETTFVTISPYSLIAVGIVFIAGMVSFSLFTQFVTTFFQNQFSIYIIWTVLAFALCHLYLLGVIPRRLSPMMYASSIDLLGTTPVSPYLLLVEFGYNLLVAAIGICFGYWVQLRK